MKNLLFWLYIILAIIAIGVGYTFWETRVTDSDAREKAIASKSGDHYYASSDTKSSQSVKKDDKQKPNNNLFKNKDFQSIYNKKTEDNKKMNITVISTPYQTSDSSANLADELNKVADPHLKINTIEVSGSSSTVSMDKIYKSKPDLILLDALTLNDFAEEVASNDHIATLESIYNAASSDNKIPTVIIGTRPEYNDSNFDKYQSAESDYFGNESNDFYYVNQSSKWPKNKAIEDYYNVEDGLLTDRGVNRWVTTITDYLFNEDNN